jgi:putative sigma-54 modulation protein
MTNDSDTTIEFKGRHDHISPRMRDHAGRKLQKLARYNDRVVRIEVVADHAHEAPEVELIVHMRRGKPLVARERAETFANTIDLLVAKMEKQLKRLKEKRKDHKVAGQRGAAARSRGRAGAPSEETNEEVVRRTLRG